MFTIRADGRLLVTFSHRGGHLLLTKVGTFQSIKWAFIVDGNGDFSVIEMGICCRRSVTEVGVCCWQKWGYVSH